MVSSFAKELSRRRTIARRGPRPHVGSDQHLLEEIADHLKIPVEKLREIEPDALTPKQALEALYALKELLGK